MTHASLFSGIGGPEVAAAMLGWDNAFHCEINPFGKAVLEYWFPNSKSYEDVTKTDFSEWRGKIDVLTAGFPCQPFSYAGRRGGADDERYLWPEACRVISEVRPTWFVGENVAGITTMVEGGVRTPLGGEATLFGEGGDLYEQRSIFTIERICQELESLGYSVQPMLIPAAAVGAPHRRDRVFIIAHNVADSYGGNDLRGAGEDEGEGRTQRLQERDEVRKSGEPGDVRSEGGKSAAHTDSGRLEGPAAGRRKGAGDNALRSDRSGCKDYAADSHSEGFQESTRSGRAEHSEKKGARVHDRVERFGGNGNAADTDSTGFQRPNNYGINSGDSRQLSRKVAEKAGQKYTDFGSLSDRWASFPTQSPVHRGNDGLPFDVDDLTISFSKWRTESLKAYGNAIVPQVMYRIFQAIEQVNQ